MKKENITQEVSAMNSLLLKSQAVLEGKSPAPRMQKFKTYAISNFRGGIGKSTIAFNIAYELSQQGKVLLLDTCSQRNFSQNIFGEAILDIEDNIYKALISEITNINTTNYADLVLNIRGFCTSFKGQTPYMIPGSERLFLFPSVLYSQLAQFSQLQSQGDLASSRILLSLKRILEEAEEIAKPQKVLIDTSPFFGGATHLTWCAAEALIIPVRVDQHSLDALRLLLEMMDRDDMDFHKFNKQAGLSHTPKIHAIVMTHCGWNRQAKNERDNSTKHFVERALELAEKYVHLFSEEDISNCFYLWDDFLNTGRISGSQRIPISCLTAGQKYTVSGRRLEVNPSVERYQKEIKHLAQDL